MDPRQLQRFQNEARAAASLEHQNIVPVYGVGCERGVHYYAMKFIEGQTLSRGHRRASSREADVESNAEHVGLTPRRSPSSNNRCLHHRTWQTQTRDHYRRIAELMANAADALEYAHSMGVVHRDVKPGNLMLDAAGKLWVADFGLAKLGADPGVTMTGDVLGTLRYMSPEQALAKQRTSRSSHRHLRSRCDALRTAHRQPAVPGHDKQEVLRRIAFEEPTKPRSIDPAIPKDLETICLKCLEKEPSRRYSDGW